MFFTYEVKLMGQREYAFKISTINFLKQVCWYIDNMTQLQTTKINQLKI